MSRQNRPERPSGNPSTNREHDETDREAELEEDEAPPAWLKKAAEQQERRQKQYASIFDNARDAVAKEKEDLSGLLKRVEAANEEEESREEAPSLFNDAAQAWQERQKSLGSLFGDAIKAREAEKDRLLKMFERPPKGKGRSGGR